VHHRGQKNETKDKQGHDAHASTKGSAGFMTVLHCVAKSWIARVHPRKMTEQTDLPEWHLDKRVPIALIFAVAVQTGAGLIWAGV